ncbi:hypothetical protein JTE90_026189 [Oedothorax gibbosus]|uniref:Exosome complex component CSL4 n=1 Tax=Oedothorax gibbosus TaxID=931172 RepID=A0AAV6U1Z3_9ARAC|nr:hypothetical protein JTE90_026189 [Oedothorax gibbosus]
MNRIQPGTLVVPGQCLCHSGENQTPGNGTYLQGEYIYSSLTGYVDSKETTIEVSKGFERSIVPNIGAIVTAKVTNIRRRFAKCAIYCVEETVLQEPFRGIIRREDVRTKDRDKVEMYKCFRPGDIILARVTSLGTMHSFNLSTAEEDLGVVLAVSEAGFEMVPQTLYEMICTKTFTKESRKVAKVVPQNFGEKSFKKFQQEFSS